MTRLLLLPLVLVAACRPASAPPAPVALAATPPYRHLPFGNVSGANATDPDNRLVQEPYFALSYNQTNGTPNWVSWTVTADDLGTAPRRAGFVIDPLVPLAQPHSSAYRSSGFDLGHVCPHADRGATKESSYATFVMSNVMPQAPALNRITWEHHEAYIRGRVQAGAVAYVIAGPAGKGGVGEKGARDEINGVTVPAYCWKVVRFAPGDTEAVVMPNRQDIAPRWEPYLTTPAAVEKLTGYTFPKE